MVGNVHAEKLMKVTSVLVAGIKNLRYKEAGNALAEQIIQEISVQTVALQSRRTENGNVLAELKTQEISVPIAEQKNNKYIHKGAF